MVRRSPHPNRPPQAREGGARAAGVGGWGLAAIGAGRRSSARLAQKTIVFPAKAGPHGATGSRAGTWIPASTGMTILMGAEPSLRRLALGRLALFCLDGPLGFG